MTTQLCEPVLRNGIRNTHFFNGRLLAAEDLQTEQVARRQHDWQLGHAIGSGVVHGLDVQLVTSGADGKDAVVAIRAGLAIDPRGQTLELPDDTEVTLVRRTAPPTEGGDFSPCTTDQPLTLPKGVGFYVLVLCPAHGTLERAPMSGLGGDGQITGCGDRYEVDGVSLRLVKLALAVGPALSADTLSDLTMRMTRTNGAVALSTDAADLSMLRNRLAHACSGTEQLREVARDPFAADNGRSRLARYGLLDALFTAGQLTLDDVPLALVYWTTDRIRFVDMWSVRRRASGVRFFDTRAPADQSGTPFEHLALDVVLGERRRREAEASFLQFQEQVEVARRAAVALDSIVATEYLHYLPAVGLLPLKGPGSAVGIESSTFFGNRASRDVAMLDGNQLRVLLDESLYHEPIDLSRNERIQLYLLWENTRGVESGAINQRTLVFANRTLPYRGTARFSPKPDPRPSGSPAYARWSRSRFARRVI